MSGKPTPGLHYERIDQGWKRQTENGTEFHYDIELGHPLPRPLMVPRDNETDIDKLQAETSDLFRQLRSVREQIGALLKQPLDVADQLTTLDERVDNIEKHCEAMDGRIHQGMSGMGRILPAEDPVVIEQREYARIEKLFEMGTDQCGIVRLERWPEGIVLWYHGIIAWRSWKK